MSDVVEIRVPAEQTEGTRSQVLRWLKSVGEQVTADEPLIEIETDKVTVEVAAPASGLLREILKQEQEEVGPGELLGRIEAEGTKSRQAPGAPTQSPGALSKPVPTAWPAGARTEGPVATRSQAAEIEQPESGPRSDSGSARSLSPAVRRLLAEHGLEPSEVHGTGQGTRITVEDILRHVKEPGAQGRPSALAARSGVRATTPAGDASPAAAEAVSERVGAVRRVPHSAIRKRIADHMVHSLLHTAPHVTTVFEANLTAVLADRDRRRQEFAAAGVPLTLTAYFVQAAAAAIRVVPEANSRWTDTALEIHESVHIGIATALENGLVVPVLHEVQSRDLLQTARGLNDLTSRAREGRLTPADVRGGTFTISNHGVSGSLFAAPIVINQPQAAILGIGKLEKRVVVVDGVDAPVTQSMSIEPRCYVTLTIDHRVMDGLQANRFMQAFIRCLETSGS